ncbi:MAG: Hsp20/alpha crystallin family protein [Ilumatobacter sp.]|uniref:Hsp20/alpha crystallin family protein n=1 Tax=Ilumatobacter sp. TaxID=1967498 RepID=UPI0026183018|nr:Hsp20/alpha crystallin family protein [Ilumatobacter sp.]MDJ0769365.1 Hsp20/alpha crystallin family protein [Ilumatobacter sp.]
MIVRHRFPFDRRFDLFDRDVDRVFEQLTGSFFDTRRGPTVSGTWKDDAYVLTADLPGVPAEAVSVGVTGNTLTLSATTDDSSWERSVRLGEQLDPDKVTAHHRDGRLTVRIGTVDEPVARLVEIDTSPARAAIEASDTEAGDTEAVPTDTD